MQLLYILSAFILAHQAVPSTQNCGRSRTFCKTYPDLCSIVVDDLLDGYKPGLPWTAMVSVEEGVVVAGNLSTITKQCMAILVSDQDLLVDTDCFDQSSSSNSSGTVHLANSTYPLSQFNATRLNSTVLISLAEESSSSTRLANISLPHSCVPSTQYVDIQGAVCGFLRNDYAHSRLSYTCRKVRFTANNPSNSSGNSEQEQWRNFEPGAAVFNHSNDMWSLVAFTSNSTKNNDSLHSLPDNCDLLKSESRGRVKCTSKPSSRAGNLVDNWGNSIFGPSTLPTASFGQSGLIPLTVLGLIILMAVVLVAYCFLHGRQRTSYSNI